MSKLIWIKLVHTLIWLFFNAVIFYLAYAVIMGEINIWVWVGLALFGVEAVILLLFNMKCPLTIIARRYSNSTKDNFDIYLPNWLARHNKLIYTIFLVIIILILAYRVVVNNQNPLL